MSKEKKRIIYREAPTQPILTMIEKAESPLERIVYGYFEYMWRFAKLDKLLAYEIMRWMFEVQSIIIGKGDLSEKQDRIEEIFHAISTSIDSNILAINFSAWVAPSTEVIDAVTKLATAAANFVPQTWTFSKKFPELPEIE